MPATAQKHGTFCWNECLTRDVESARKFYCELLGWEAKTVDMGPMGTYIIFTQEGQEVGGMMQMSGPQFEGVPTHWLSYISVNDVDKYADTVEKLGGKVHCPPRDIPNVGRFCVISDPSGAYVGLITLNKER